MSGSSRLGTASASLASVRGRAPVQALGGHLHSTPVRQHDITLAKLDSPLHINRPVQSICLPHAAAMYPSVGSTCMATGWGDISEDGPSSEELREVEVPRMAKCERSYNNISY